MSHMNTKFTDELNKDHQEFLCEFYTKIQDIAMDDKFKMAHALIQEINMADNEQKLYAGATWYKPYIDAIDGWACIIKNKIAHGCRED